MDILKKLVRRLVDFAIEPFAYSPPVREPEFPSDSIVGALYLQLKILEDGVIYAAFDWGPRDPRPDQEIWEELETNCLNAILECIKKHGPASICHDFAKYFVALADPGLVNDNHGYKMIPILETCLQSHFDITAKWLFELIDAQWIAEIFGEEMIDQWGPALGVYPKLFLEGVTRQAWKGPSRHYLIHKILAYQKRRVDRQEMLDFLFYQPGELENAGLDVRKVYVK